MGDEVPKPVAAAGPPTESSSLVRKANVSKAGEREVVALAETGTLPGLQRGDERPDLYLNGMRWERLTPAHDPDVEFLRVTYPPRTESCPADNLMNHGGSEYIHMLAGHLEVQVAFARQVLGPGDSLNFDSTIPHRLSNPSDEPAVGIWFILDRSGTR